MDYKLNEAIDNPEKFYWNVLLEDDDVFNENAYSNSYIFLSILLFLVSHKNDNEQHVNNFIKKYYYQIEKESNNIKKIINGTDNGFLNLCEKYPVIRDIIYRDEKKILSECVTEEDYVNYVNLYGNSNREFLLFAKYRIALLKNQSDCRFDAIPEIISSYPNSDLFDIVNLKTLCEVINGIIVCFKSNITENQKEAIASILDKAIYDKETMAYIINSPLNKFQFIKLQDFNDELLLAVVSNMNETIYLNKDEAEHVLSTLFNLTGLLWAFPKKETVNDNALFSQYKNQIWVDVESDSSIKTYYYLQPIIKTEK